MKYISRSRKLSDEQVYFIREKYGTTEKYILKYFSEKYNVSKLVVFRVVKNQTYKHLLPRDF